MNINLLHTAFIMLLLSTSLAAADRTGILTRDSELRNAPGKTADSIATLAAQSKVRIHRRQGGWYEISQGEKTGWVRLLTVKHEKNGKRQKPDHEEKGIDELLGGLATGHEKSNKVTAATAVRGIDEEELKNAEPDPAALEQLEHYAVDADTGQAAADEVGLQNKHVEYITAGRSKDNDDNRSEDE